ncbi:MAG: efflux RND transporter periplasmic adaptor subunit, partial [Planctomycetota bacterium]
YETALANKIISEADVAVAEKSITEYLEGTFKEEEATIQKEIFDAEQALRAAKLKYESATRLAAKGMVRDLQLESEQYSVESARKELELKTTRLESLRKYTKVKKLQELESTLDAAKARLAADESSLALEKQRLEREKQQLENCKIEAPGEGIVIFPSAAAWKETPDIEEGAIVREQQTLLMIPDLNKMQVKLGIHESKVDRLNLGMIAKVQLQGFDLEGEVEDIAEVTRPAGWWTGNLVKYDTIIRLPVHPGLKPGMSAIVDVVLAAHEDVLTLPVAAILETPDGFMCWVKPEVGKPEKRLIEVGDTNDEFTIVTSGLAEGEEVVLNPLAFIDEAQVQAIKMRRTEGGSTSTEGEVAEDEAVTQGNSAGAMTGNKQASGGDKKPAAKASVGQMIITAADKNGDGFLTEDEVPEKDRAGFPDSDSNGDGKLSAQEIDAAIEAAKAAAGQ